MYRHERKIWKTGITYIAGVDEAGRGPLAGPVVAAAVVVTPGLSVAGVNDSKQLTPLQRDVLFDRIVHEAQAVGVGIVENSVIDRINILNATFQAMHQAIRALQIRPEHLLIDGNRFLCDPLSTGDPVPFTTLVRGDASSFSIAAASIVAKVTRDRIMREYDGIYPGYGFAHHKGYAIQQHREAILRLGLCPIHRRTFACLLQYEFRL